MLYFFNVGTAGVINPRDQILSRRLLHVKPYPFVAGMPANLTLIFVNNASKIF